MRKLIGILVILAALLFFGVMFGGGKLLETGVEKGGSWALGNRTELSSASLNVFGGEAGMKGLEVGNLEGFQRENAFEVDGISVKADVKSFLSDLIEIEHITIDEPKVTIELAKGGTNLGALLKKLESRRGPSAPEQPDAKDEDAPQKKLHVGRVTITSPRVEIAQSMLLSTSQEFVLPTLELTDLGGADKGGEGMTLPELLEQIIGAIMTAVGQVGALPQELLDKLNAEAASEFLNGVRKNVEQVGKEAFDKVGEDVKKGLGDLKEKAGQGLEDLKEKAGGLGDKLEDAKEGLGGLLPGGKKKDEKQDG